MIPSIASSLTPFITLYAINDNERDYKYLDITLKIWTISFKSILIIYSKIFLKIKDLAYFNKIKKHSKI